jgi:hypothetical protein
MAPAKTLREASQAADPRPLASGDPFFVDLSQARSTRVTEDMRRTIENCAPGRFASIAFSGHRGSGKSTELKRLQNLLAPTCFSFYLDVNEYLDAADVEYTDLFLLVSRRVIEELHQAGVPLDQNLLTAVEQWFLSVTKETQQTVALSAGVTTQASAGFEFPFIAKLLAKLTADVKAGTSQKTTTRQELDRYFTGLASNANLLLTAASQALQKDGRPSQVLILVDNLDRVPPKKAEDLIYAHGSQLQAMNCHAVYTISIDTYYSRTGIGTVFPDRFLLPNVKLRISKTDPGPNETAIAAMGHAIERRLDVNTLLNPPELARAFVARSGGSLRQLVRLLRQAVLSTQARQLAAIDRQALDEAALNLQQEFERSLTPADYPLLARTAATKSIEKNDPYMGLLRNIAILEYNGMDIWHDVNPLVEPIDAFQAARKKPAKGKRSKRRGR